jgi:hypothetical protein
VLTIHSLEVRFDVEGSDEEVFARLFQKFMSQWSRVDAARRQLDVLAAGDRALGDRPDEEVATWR